MRPVRFQRWPQAMAIPPVQGGTLAVPRLQRELAARLFPHARLEPVTRPESVPRPRAPRSVPALSRLRKKGRDSIQHPLGAHVSAA